MRIDGCARASLLMITDKSVISRRVKKKSKRDHQSPNSDFNNLRAETLIGGLFQLSSRDPCDYMVIDSVY